MQVSSNERVQKNLTERQHFQQQIQMSSFMACRTPKLIVHGVEDFSRLDEIVRFGKNYQIKNFDIVKMENEGIITLIFAVHQEAVDFGQYLE
jgi:hypothetical protein